MATKISIWPWEAQRRGLCRMSRSRYLNEEFRCTVAKNRGMPNLPWRRAGDGENSKHLHKLPWVPSRWSRYQGWRAGGNGPRNRGRGWKYISLFFVIPAILFGTKVLLAEPVNLTELGVILPSITVNAENVSIDLKVNVENDEPSATFVTAHTASGSVLQRNNLGSVSYTHLTLPTIYSV